MSEEQVHETGSESVVSETATTNTSEEFNFKEMISEDLREDPSLQDIKDLNSLAKGYVSAQRMMGNRIPIPGEDASDEVKQEFYNKIQNIPGVAKIPQTDEEKEAFYTKLGRPESPDKYKMEVPEIAAQDETAVESFKHLAHTLGLNNEQAQKLVNFYSDAVLEPQLSQWEEQKEIGQKALKEKWGADYEARMNGAKTVVSLYSQKYPDLMNELVSGPTGNNPAFIEMLSDLAQNLSESEVLAGIQKTQYGTTREEALETIREIRHNNAHAFHNPSDPDHDAAVQKMRKLYSIAYPDE